MGHVPDNKLIGYRRQTLSHLVNIMKHYYIAAVAATFSQMRVCNITYFVFSDEIRTRRSTMDSNYLRVTTILVRTPAVYDIKNLEVHSVQCV